MTTMKDIALRTGVSVSTVSLVLNGRDRGRVKPQIADRVHAVARELDYLPNAAARSLRTNRSQMLGFVSMEVATTPYAGGIILGAQEAASEAGYVLATVSADGAVDLDQEIGSLMRHGVDGFLFSTMSNRVSDIPDSLAEHPLVLADTVDAQGRFPAIVPDEFRIGHDATTRLARAGLTRIAYVGCTAPMVAQEGRLRGYRQALEDAGLPYDAALVCDVLYNDGALARVERLFDEARPDGVFCFNDSRAWYVYECAARRGLTIGKDVSVVGVDNHPVVSETFSPQLTTIALPHYEMGYWAASKLISMIDPDAGAGTQWPHTTAPIPPLDAPEPVRIHCTLLERNSVRA
ncbi:LacI family DNA-binding transcriptional regulator [Bifidobacterium cuniculi]|uniref:LacI family transcriptional regulator n=1 Tax=Bifidobacterium cuniculi TaxID=1688 RepID=A0A087ARS0_9BIFI|nr:LacI family DNA-binding transcriptional regulator [Bifidobacterium cuniculi]KFI61470.1 LacI family transcriptional regulator [Bifidobacterium cuniculi]